MRFLTFSGGIHPPEFKWLTEKKPVEVIPPPDRVVIHVRQNIGSHPEPVVKAGDHVDVGTVIAKETGFVSAPVHSSVSGTVKDIKLFPHPAGKKSPAILIESDGKDTRDPQITDIKRDYEQEAPAALLDIIQQAGMVGLGGASFPTHVKLAPPPNKKIHSIILNGAECEPYLTADHRLSRHQQARSVNRLNSRNAGCFSHSMRTDSAAPPGFR